MKLILLRRSLHIADDDLAIPAILTFVLNLIFFIGYLLSCIVSLAAKPAAISILQILYCLSNLGIFYYSLKGSISDPIPRKPIKSFIYISLILKLVIFALVIDLICITTISFSFLFITLCLHISYIVIYYSILLILFLSSTDHKATIQDTRRFWKRRIQFLCLGFRTRDEVDINALSDISKTLSEFFHDNTFSPTDILVGVLLLRRLQIQKLYSISSPSRSLDLERSSPGYYQSFENLSLKVKYSEIQHLLYYYDFAEAIYGFPLYMFENIPAGLQFICCPCIPLKQTKLSIIKTMFTPGYVYKLPSDPNLLHISIKNHLFHPPYFVWNDGDVVVIAIRGTLSTSDLVVDLNCELIDVNINGKLEKTHGGIYKSAVNIEKDIADLLNRIYGKVVVVGHSLGKTLLNIGGGVAALLTHLIRQKYQRIEATCIAYGPPGCIASESSSLYFKEFCTSVVIGSDLVPRLSRKSVQDMDESVRTILNNCKHPKSRVLAGLVGRLFKPRTPSLLHRYLVPNWIKKIVDEEYITETESLLVDTRPRMGDANLKMFMPGKVLHFAKDTRKLTEIVIENPSHVHLAPRNNKRRIYTPVWADSETFKEIIISPTMVSDHLPNNSRNLFDEVFMRGYQDDDFVEGVSY